MQWPEKAEAAPSLHLQTTTLTTNITKRSKFYTAKEEINLAKQTMSRSSQNQSQNAKTNEIPTNG